MDQADWRKIVILDAPVNPKFHTPRVPNNHIGQPQILVVEIRPKSATIAASWALTAWLEDELAIGIFPGVSPAGILDVHLPMILVICLCIPGKKAQHSIGIKDVNSAFSIKDVDPIPEGFGKNDLYAVPCTVLKSDS
jgi:hypothetical protein